MSLEGNDTYKDNLVKLFKAKTKCLKNIKRKKIMQIKRQVFKIYKRSFGGNANI